MKKLVILLFIFTQQTFASECTITHYVIPPAKKIDWTSRKSLIKSYVKSQVSALKYSRQDTQRKAIGHVVSHIKLNQYERWTSISINSMKMFRPVIRHGLKAIFLPVKGATIQNKKEILRFIKNNRTNYRQIKMSALESECNQLIELDNNLRQKAKKNMLYFGPTIHDIAEGGTGASYAVHMIKFIDPTYPVESFKQNFNSRKNTFEFFDSYNIWKSLQSN